MTAFAAAHKVVTLDVNGETSQVTTFANTVGGVLAAQDVKITERDLVAPALAAGVPRGGQIVVRSARPLALTIDGEQQTVWTTATTVAEALADLGVRAEEASLSVSRNASVSRLDGMVTVSTPKVLSVSVDGAAVETLSNATTVGAALAAMGVVLDPADSVSPALDAATEPGQVITVLRAVSSNGIETQAIPFETVREEDPTLTQGTTKVVQRGQLGQRSVTYISRQVGGQEIAREVVLDVLVAAPVTEVVKVGTKPPSKSSSKGGGEASAPAVTANVDPASAQGIAKAKLAARGWGDDQFACLVSLWNRESGWNVSAANKSSGAYGIPQALPGSKMASAGSDWRTNPATQIEWGLGYIAGRYSTPCGAWSAFKSKGWY
jgi:uncharacterized protein YabE (DUF348 family)